jgi:hypothetical protein
LTLVVQIPTVGLSNASEEPKITNTLTNLSAWANGNIPDSDLRSPNNTLRRLILQSAAIIDDEIGAGDKLFTADSFLVASGAQCYSPVPVWAGDSGLSGNPADFQVQNKTAFGRVRVSVLATQSASLTLTIGLYQVTAISGTSRGIAYTFGSQFAGSPVAITNPAAGITSAESGELFLPTAAGVFALGANLSAPAPAGAALAVTAQLYAYNN